ncbi:dTMP kinase [Litorilinea aerophila]|uniref:Thymidylate kinase n=1 Tax=Litorilinea aerophila TaxID=1204385 RepID=A0A540VAC8_9CHLR|nr:dTMP kinase [Litorilinea aerophila]MCC9078428.1 dTMP kinase [Litorilinea aerophila]
MGLLITFEGPEGSGKSTQIRLLAQALADQGLPVLTTREPGGTAIGNAIRALLLDPVHSEMSPRAETLLFTAARAQLVDEIIRPALAAGQIVLCDRYADSTLAYQGYGHGQSLEELRRLNQYATGGLQPDLTIYLDLDPELGLARKQAGAQQEWNRMEEQALDFHRAVRQGYLALAAQEPGRWLVIDATRPVDWVQRAIWQRVEPVCRAHGTV